MAVRPESVDSHSLALVGRVVRKAQISRWGLGAFRPIRRFVPEPASRQQPGKVQLLRQGLRPDLPGGRDPVLAAVACNRLHHSLKLGPLGGTRAFLREPRHRLTFPIQGDPRHRRSRFPSFSVRVIGRAGIKGLHQFRDAGPDLHIAPAGLVQVGRVVNSQHFPAVAFGHDL